jgi:hypothetical protein
VYISELDGSGTLYFGAAEQNGFDSSLFVTNLIDSLSDGKLTNCMGADSDRARVPFSHGDDMIFALQFITPDGEPIGSLIRFAAHAVCCNRAGSYSSDYPYYARRRMQDSLGGIAMFLNGPCAEIAPAMIDKQEGRERPLGEYIATVAIDAISRAEYREISSVTDAMIEISLPVRREVLDGRVEIPPEMPDTLPERKRYLELCRLERTLPFLREKYAEGEREPCDRISVYLGFLRLGEVVFAAFPGETFWATGDAVKATFPDQRICTVTEHERTVMYLPPYDEFLRGGYESICKTTAPESESILRREAIDKIEKYL